MKLLFDTQTFDIQRYGGISRYYTELLKFFENCDEVTTHLPIKYSENENVKEVLSGLKRVSSLEKFSYNFYGDFSKRKKHKRLYNNHVSLVMSEIEMNNFDVFVPTYYDVYYLGKLNKPFVLTVHDMIHEKLNDNINLDEELVKNKKLLIDKATQIITVSQNTKKDILELYPATNANKITVSYLAAEIIKKINPSIELPEKYILFVGNREKYKNFNFFVKALEPLLQQQKDLFIVCAGGGDFKKNEKPFLDGISVRDRILYKDLTEDNLYTFYSRAICFVFPSMYEGFGIPVLEAMGSGCPVVLSQSSSFPEVAADAALFFDLNNSKDILDKVSFFLFSEKNRQHYIEKGLQRAQKFSWKKTAETCYEVYKKAQIAL